MKMKWHPLPGLLGLTAMLLPAAARATDSCPETIPDGCYTLYEAHAKGILTITSGGSRGEAVTFKNSGAWPVCLDSRALYTSLSTQSLYMDQDVVASNVTIPAGGSYTLYYGSWTTYNNYYRPYYGYDAWWCVESAQLAAKGYTYGYYGEEVPSTLSYYTDTNTDVDGDGRYDLLDWAGSYGVQANYNVWSYQNSHAVLTVGKVAQNASGDALVILTARNFGYYTGTGTVTDTIPAGWTLDDASSTPASQVTNPDGSTTVTWSVSVTGTSGGVNNYSQEITYYLVRNVEADVPYLELPEASIYYHDRSGYQTSYSLPAVVYDMDVNGDGAISCPTDEVCDGVDNDLDGVIDNGMADADSDGVCDGMDSETCDGVDNDGDGLVDEGFDADSDGYADCFEQCEVTERFCSDEDGLNVLADGTPAVLTYDDNARWTARIAGAEWIWDEAFETQPGIDQIQSIYRSFTVHTGAYEVDAVMEVGADNSYQTWLNGDLVGEDPYEFNYFAPTDVWDMTDSVQEGTNTLEWEVWNWAQPGGSAYSNPGGVIYCVNVSYSYEMDPEICDGQDNDCDGLVDEGTPDADADGVCDAFDAEVCDGLDNDGDGVADEGMDADADGLADCFDTEQCDGVDNDGDGLADEDMGDSDADGLCDALDTEVCDGVDNDGDGAIDEGMTDVDADGLCDALDAEECDGADNDGDGLADEDFDTDGDGYTSCTVPSSCDVLMDIYHGEDTWADPYSYTTQHGWGYAMDDLLEAGYTWDANDAGISEATFGGYEALIVSEPVAAFAADEVESILDYVYQGGGLLLATDFNDIYMNPIATALGVSFNGYADLISWQRIDTWDTGHDVSNGIDSVFWAYGSTFVVTNPDVRVLGTFGTDAVYAVLEYGDGRVVFSADNELFAGYGWFGTSDPAPSVERDNKDLWLQTMDWLTDCQPPAPEDCDDTDASVNPGGAESCNALDDDCDGLVDEGFDSDSDSITDCNDTEECDNLDNDGDGLVDDLDPSVTGQGTWYSDADGDGHGAGGAFLACFPGTGTSASGDDCDDAAAAVNPDATEVCNATDDDCDVAVDEGMDSDADGLADCFDTEECDGLDNDGDGLVDDLDPSVTGQGTWYADADADGFGDGAASTLACVQPEGTVADATDCDDTNGSVFPGATEICNGIDDDCDALADDADGDVTGRPTWYADTDGDGYGDPAVSLLACAPVGTWVADRTDCDDTDAAVNPYAAEVCNAIDDDCDDSVDEGMDSDMDAIADCFDTEECDGVDNDGDGLADDADPDVVGQGTWYADADGDGYGDLGAPLVACQAPTGYGTDTSDCDDTDAAVNPAAAEVCNGLDDDCDDTVDEAFDSDLDAIADCFDTEECDGLDNDGDAGVDEDEVCGCDEFKPTDCLTLWQAHARGWIDIQSSAGSGAIVTFENTGPYDVCLDAQALYTSGASQPLFLDEAVVSGGARVEPGDTFSTYYGSWTTANGAYQPYLGQPAWWCYVSGIFTAASVAFEYYGEQVPEAMAFFTLADTDVDANGRADVTEWYGSYGVKAQYNVWSYQQSHAILTAGKVAEEDGTGLRVTLTSRNLGYYDGFGVLTDTVPAGWTAGDFSVAPATEVENGDGSVTYTWNLSLIGTAGGVVIDRVQISYSLARDAGSDAPYTELPEATVAYDEAEGPQVNLSMPAGAYNVDVNGDGTVACPETEVCNDLDDDLDGLVDEEAVDMGTWYMDVDADGYGDGGAPVLACDPPAGTTTDTTDCDDADATSYPGAVETCDARDNDCNGEVDDVLFAAVMVCLDGDGDGSGANPVPMSCATTGPEYITSCDDCDDANAQVSPAAPEVCNGLDDDCDALVDDADPTIAGQGTWYADADGDGYGNATSSVLSCSIVAGFIADRTDCDDANAGVHPGASDLCNGLDEDCDGIADNGNACGQDDCPEIRPTECLTLWQAHSRGWLQVASSGWSGVLVNFTNTGGYEVCLDEAALYTSSGTQSFYLDDAVVDAPAHVAVGGTFTAYYGSWTTDNNVYEAYLGQPAWWCVESGQTATAGATFDFYGERIPQVLEYYTAAATDEDGDGKMDDVDWAGSYGVQANYNIWAYQQTHGVLTIGKTAMEAGAGLEVVLTARNIGYDDASGTITDTIPAGWTLESSSLAPTSTLYDSDGGTTVSWDVSVLGTAGGDTVWAETLTYVLSRDAGSDAPYVELPEASLDYAQAEGWLTSYSLPAAVYNLDVNGDGVVSCPETEVCDAADNDLDGLVDEDFDADDDGIADCFDEETCDGLDNDGDGLVDEVCSGSVAGLVWLDVNNNGSQDCYEPGLDGLAVTATGPDCDGDGAADTLSVTTDEDGLYLFDEVCPGTWSVEWADNPRYDVPSTPNPASVVVGGDEDVADVDFGSYRAFVYHSRPWWASYISSYSWTLPQTVGTVTFSSASYTKTYLNTKATSASVLFQREILIAKLNATAFGIGPFPVADVNLDGQVEDVDWLIDYANDVILAKLTTVYASWTTWLQTLYYYRTEYDWL